MSARDILVKVGSWWFLDRIVVGVAALVTQVLLARFLGVDQFGHVAYVLGVTAILFPIAQMGVGGIVGAAIVGNAQEHREILAAALGWRLIGGTVAAMLGALYWVVSDPLPAALSVVILISLSLLPLGFSFLEFSFQATQRPQLVIPWRLTATLCGTVLKIAAACLGGLNWLLATIALDFALQGLAHLFAYRAASGEWLQPSFTNRWFPWIRSRNMLLLASGIAEALYLRIDLAMLGTMSSPAETAVYSVAARLSEVWMIIPTVLVAALAPTLFSPSRAATSANFDIQATLDALSATAITIIILMILFGEPLIDALFGQEYLPAATVLGIHVWSILFLFARALYSRYLLSADMMKESLISTTSGAAMNIVLNSLLIPSLGAKGAAIATLISYGLAGWLILFAQESTRPMAIMMSKSFMPFFRIFPYIRNIKTLFFFRSR